MLDITPVHDAGVQVLLYLFHPETRKEGQAGATE